MSIYSARYVRRLAGESRTLAHFETALDLFPHEWGWHFENDRVLIDHPRGDRWQRQIAVHVGPLVLTVWSPPVGAE
jgi:hypothetical protein